MRILKAVVPVKSNRRCCPALDNVSSMALPSGLERVV